MDLSTPTSPLSAPKNAASLAQPAPAADEVVSTDPLDALLKQIIGGWFLLTDGQGAVSKWSEPAELLFGKEAPEALGHSFFEGLLAGPLGPEAEQWRRFLAAGDPPNARALVEVGARHAPTGQVFPLEAVFIPVKLDEGFDFSLFLEDLSFELPMNLMLLRMRQQHPVVVRAMQAALDAEPQPWDGWRTAGTLVAFRPLGPTPWVEDELVRRAEERSRQDAEREEAITNTDPGVHGGSIDDLDDAAAVVARLLSALERIDDLERIAGRLPAEVDEAKREAQAGRAHAESAEREARLARAELERLEAAPAAGTEPDPAAEAERSELRARLERLERDRVEAAAGWEARLAAAFAEAGEARSELERRLAELEAAGGDALDSARTSMEAEFERLRGELARDVEVRRAQLDRIDRERDAARDELGASLEHMGREHARGLEATRAELAVALERVGAVQQDAERLRQESARGAETTHALRADLDAVRAGESEARAAVEALRAELAAVREGDDRSGSELRRQLEQLREGTVARADFDDLHRAFDALRDGGVGRTDLEAIREQLSTLADGWAAKADIDAVRGELAALGGGVPTREELEGLRRQFAEARDGAAGQEQLDVLQARIDRLEAGDEGERLSRLGADAEALRTAVDDLHGRVDAARGEAAAARERAEAGAAEAEQARAAARASAERIDAVDRGASAVLAEVRATGERLEEVAGVARAAQEAAGAGLEQAAQAARGEVEGLRRELDAGRERLEGAVAEAGAGRERIAALETGVERLAQQIEANRAQSESRAAGLMAELGAVRTLAEQSSSGVTELRAMMDALREETAAARTQAELAGAVAEKARASAERAKADDARFDALQAEVEEMKAGLNSAGQAALVARREAEEARQVAEHAGDGANEHVTQVFREILGLAAKGSRTRPLEKPAPPPVPAAREPRPGFDDESVPMAVLGTDGKFKEINPSFCRLVGYQEHEFAKAAWPSPHDRQHYAQQQEQLAELVAGTLERVPVQSTYMHGQGLMVPVIGEIIAVKGEDGLPSHLLLRAEERERTDR